MDMTHGNPWGVPWDPGVGTMGAPWVGSLSLLGLNGPLGLLDPWASWTPGPRWTPGPHGTPGNPGVRVPGFVHEPYHSWPLYFPRGQTPPGPP